MVWDPSNGTYGLPQNLIIPLYRKAAMIFTCFFNLETLEHIVNWSHAAGDFILKLRKDKVALKLISVRQYKAPVENAENDPKSIVEAMLIFLVNLSLKMRIDRLDGIGDLAWADNRAVAGTVKGFFDGLAKKASSDPLSGPFSVFFKQYLLGCTEDDLYEVADAILNTYRSAASEDVLIRNYLGRHISCLHKTIRSFR
jgi:hypothetical protein